ncbi:SDR family oxidoreductase [Fodinicola feengrottensis]|uniref:SDR family oxidoreductase n=1 Tax=Fodinicola feengrottensis TaxID=435914 RepID=UPI002441A810|nr:SDR family NAD(P)-dependent oxidoreductase [Fodinicola feengrottensis]
MSWYGQTSPASFGLIHGTLDQIREREGDIVLISSISAAWPSHSGAAYSATKAALLGLARGLSRDEHANGVRVCTILPGMVDTPMLDRRPVPPPVEMRKLCLQPEDVADAALCAVSLPGRATIAEISILATRLQSLGYTQQATPDIPDGL